MYCERCEKYYLDIHDINHTKESCDEEQIPMTEEEFRYICEHIFNWEIEQGNYGKRTNDGLRRLQKMIKSLIQ